MEAAVSKVPVAQAQATEVTSVLVAQAQAPEVTPVPAAQAQATEVTPVPVAQAQATEVTPVPVARRHYQVGEREIRDPTAAVSTATAKVVSQRSRLTTAPKRSSTLMAK
jgi:hypothetical protein